MVPMPELFRHRSHDAVFKANLEFVRPDDGERDPAVHWMQHLQQTYRVDRVSQ